VLSETLSEVLSETLKSEKKREISEKSVEKRFPVGSTLPETALVSSQLSAIS